MTPDEEYLFQPGHASVPHQSPHLKRRPNHQDVQQTLSLLSAIPPPQMPSLSSPHNDLKDQDLIDIAVNNACIPLEGKQRLRQLLETNFKVCTLRVGRTNVLQHQLYITHPVPIKQRPYRLTPSKQTVVKEQLEEML